MTTILASTSLSSREELWLDADFDLPDGVLLDAPSDKDDDEDVDWDIQFNLGKTGGAKAKAVVTNMVLRSGVISKPPTPTFNIIRPPIQGANSLNEEDEEGVSTIKATSTIKGTTFQSTADRSYPSTLEEDIEDAFDLPSNLTQLSLAPQALSHRSSKNSLEWSDKDQTSSSQSSDAYSSLGLADIDPSSVSTSSTSSVSLHESETEDEDENNLDGLIIPTAIFDSGHGVHQLKLMLEMKKNAQYICNQVKVTSPDPEDDFEAGLVFDNDADLSPGRLLCQQQSKRHFSRSNTVPLSKSPERRRPPRVRSDCTRPKSPMNPPVSSARQLQKLHRLPSPSAHSQTSHSVNTLSALSKSTLLPKPGSLRGQKSHSGLKSPTPTSTRKLARKASLSCLLASGHVQEDVKESARYEEPTASSRARTHKNTASRIYDKIPPNRPSTPSSNLTALRLTMPTQSRIKSRPALSSVFSSATQGPCAASAIPPMPHPSSSKLPTTKPATPPAPKVLRRPKRLQTYGDGTELDGIDDLPTDREKETKYRIQPKGYGNRIPGATYSSILKSSAGSLRMQEKQIVGSVERSSHLLRHTTTRIGTTAEQQPQSEMLPKKTKKFHGTRRKPTLIRNLNSASAPKVIGDMRWNPNTLRWEGNDQILRDFDAAIGTSTRPALITHLTGSSIGSPVGSFTSGARRVGNMIFDPARMCWISTLPPEDEPDVFANLADDEDDCSCWERRCSTICDTPSATSTANSSLSTSQELPDPAHTHSRTISESGSDRGSRASLVVCDIDELFLERCQAAEERHRTEMKGWRSLLCKHGPLSEPDRSYLYEIRALATRKY